MAYCVSSSGRKVDYEDVESTEVDVSDLRAHLSRLCRYGGAMDWTVLQHLALCTLMAKDHGPIVAGYAAAHDLHEAYVGDIAKPIILGSPVWDWWMAMEERWAAHVHKSLGLAWPPPDQTAEIVSAIDKRALFVEAVTCRGPETMREAPSVRRGGPELTARETDIGSLVRGQQRPALWSTVHKAIVAARDELKWRK